MGAIALMSVSVFAPASIGNVSVGFDVLGMAVKPIDGTLLGDVVTAEHASENSLKVIGNFANKLPSDPKENIVWDCLILFNQALTTANIDVFPIALTLDKKMPVGSGLGSSACSVVAALEVLNAFYDFPFEKMFMLKLMGQMEAQISGSLHYDNVAPCYLGGLQLMLPDSENVTCTLPGFQDCYYIMAYPGIEVSTKAAREVLPTSYSRSDVITFGQNLAAFVDACHRQNIEQAFAHFNDVVAEPYRYHLLPGFEKAREHLLAEGCLAAGISGSGPTLFAVCDDKAKAHTLALWLQENYLQTELGFVHVCQLDQEGTEVLNNTAVA
jgi:homoserine kinase